MKSISRITSFFNRCANRHKAGIPEPADVPSSEDVKEYFDELDKMCPGIGKVGILVMNEDGTHTTVGVIERSDERRS